MDSPQVKSAAVRTLSTFLRSHGLTRMQMGLVALAIVALLYAALWTAIGRTGMGMSPQDAQPVATESTTILFDGETSSEEAPSEETASDDGTLSPTFLGEYDRLAGASSATEGNTGAQTSATNPTSSTSSMLFSLVVVAGLAYAGVWGYRQILMRRQGLPLTMDGKRLSIQETQSLGPNQKLHLVRLGDEVLLLGATEHTISCLARYGSEPIANSFDEHLAIATRPVSTESAATPEPIPLQESLDALRKIQHRQRGGDNA